MNKLFRLFQEYSRRRNSFLRLVLHSDGSGAIEYRPSTEGWDHATRELEWSSIQDAVVLLESEVGYVNLT